MFERRHDFCVDCFPEDHCSVLLSVQKQTIMMEILIAVLSTLGATIIFVAAIVILRMPDFYLRLSVDVKAATLGVGIFLLCAAIVFPYTEVAIKSLAIIYLLMMTSTVAAHVMDPS